MEEIKNYQYYVVEFIDPPYSDFDKYVCVPDSWVVLREVETQTSFVKYPVEKLSLTNKRVKIKENFVNSWSLFKTNVKFGTDSYNKAKDYIKVLSQELRQERSYSESVKDGNESSTSVRNVNKPMTSARNSESSTETSPQPATCKMVPNWNLPNSNTNSLVDRNSVYNKRHFTQQSHLSQLSNNKSLSSRLISSKQKEVNLEVNSVNRDSDKTNTAVDHVNSGLKIVERNRMTLFDHDFLVALEHMKSCLEIERKRQEQSFLKLKKCAAKLQILKELIENFHNNSTDCQVTNITAPIQSENNQRKKFQMT